ncbi:MAG: hypothetical protein ACI8TE_001480 [Francisella sp.]|jgi:hypothetical protein
MEHKNSLLIGLLVTIVGGIVLYVIIPRSQNNIVVPKDTKKDWCLQTYGIKTPPEYIQNQSAIKCFYPLVYTIIDGNKLKCKKNIFYKDIYTHNYQLNIGNISNKKNLKTTKITIKTNPENYVGISCDPKPNVHQGSLSVYENINNGKSLYCAITILSYNQNISKPKFYIKNYSIDSTEIPLSLWTVETIGFERFYNSKYPNKIFKPIDIFFKQASFECQELP